MPVHVDVLELRGGRQHVVGVVGGVGLEVLEHDGEQVLAREALRHLARLRRHRDRIAVVDDQRVDRRLAPAADASPIVLMLIVRGVRPAEQVGPLQRARCPSGTCRSSTAARRPRGSRQAPVKAGSDAIGAHRVAAAAHALHAVVEADRRRTHAASSRAPGPRTSAASMPQIAATRCGSNSRARAASALEAERVAVDVVAVEPALADQHVHQAERERAVGAGQQRDVLVALFGGQRCGTDRSRSAWRRLRLASCANVQRCRFDVIALAAPEDDQLAVGERLHRRADLGAERVRKRFAAGATSRSCDRGSSRRACGRSAPPSPRPAPAPSCRRS